MGIKWRYRRLEDEPKIEEMFYVIRTKINETEGKDAMFSTYNKKKQNPLNNRNIKLRIRKYLVDVHICSIKAVMKLIDAYFIHANFDN